MEYNFNITPSMGIAIYPSDGQDGISLLKNADKALKLAKEKVKILFVFTTWKWIIYFNRGLNSNQI